MGCPGVRSTGTGHWDTARSTQGEGKMMHRVLTLAMVLALGLFGVTLVGCEQESGVEEATEDIGEGLEDTGNGIEDGLEETGDDLEEVTE